jgi:hypothetical protein
MLILIPLPDKTIFFIHSHMILRVSTVADLTNKFGIPKQAIDFALKRKRKMTEGPFH